LNRNISPRRKSFL